MYVFSLYPSLFTLCTIILNKAILCHVWWIWIHRGAEHKGVVLSIIRCFQWCGIRKVCREDFSDILNNTWTPWTSVKCLNNCLSYVPRGSEQTLWLQSKVRLECVLLIAILRSCSQHQRKPACSDCSSGKTKHSLELHTHLSWPVNPEQCPLPWSGVCAGCPQGMLWHASAINSN